MLDHVVLVCGGRGYTGTWSLYAVLDSLVPRPTKIIEGGQTGADRKARQWAIARGIPFQTFEANWKGQGKAAGPIRNRKMLVEGKPHKVVAFKGNSGTANMVAQAKAAGVPVFEVP